MTLSKLILNPPTAYLFVTLLLGFMAASIKKSRIIDFLGERVLNNTDEKTAIMALISFSYILAPFFLSFVLISSFDKWVLRFKSKKKALTLLVASALMGSIITPFGNLRNVYLSLASGNGTPGFSIFNFLSIMLPLWIAGLIILLLVTYLICGKDKIKKKNSDVGWRKPELIFSLVLFVFIFAYFNVKSFFNLNLLGLLLLGGIFCLLFMGMETLKTVNWWLFIPVGLSFIVYYFLPLKNLNFTPWIVFFMGGVGSAVFSSNSLSLILPFISQHKSVILYSVSVGSLAGVLGAYEVIWFWKKGRTKVNWKQMFGLFGIFFLISLIILFLRR